MKTFVVHLCILLSFVILTMPKDAPADDKNNASLCKSSDIVIAIDDTYSMHGAIWDIKRASLRLLDLIETRSGGDYRLGLVSFKDSVTIHEDLNAIPSPEAKKERMINAIKDLFAWKGQGGPEASDEALNTILHALPAAGRQQNIDFNGKFTSRTRIIILITDNLPGGFDDIFREGIDDVNAAKRAHEAKDMDVRISSIFIPTNHFKIDPKMVHIMREYANITNGLFAMSRKTGKGTADAIASIIDTCGMRPLV